MGPAQSVSGGRSFKRPKKKRISKTIKKTMLKKFGKKKERKLYSSYSILHAAVDERKLN